MKSSSYGSSSRPVLVTTIQFKKVIEIGEPVSQAKIYEAQAADELIFLDLDATLENRGPMLEVIKKAAEQIFMPFTVGGGVKSINDFSKLLSNGADKVSINSAAVNTPELINQGAEKYGSQCVVLSIDYRKNEEGRNLVWTTGGRVKTSLNPIEWAVEGEKRGAGEILLTCIDRDGTCSGLDIEVLREVVEKVSVPVIASGGCGLASHFVEGFTRGKADAISAGTYFCFKDENPMQTRSQVRNAGIPIRLHH